MCVIKPTSNSEVKKVAKKESQSQDRETEASSLKTFLLLKKKKRALFGGGQEE